jgi:DNA topoisomerase-1
MQLAQRLYEAGLITYMRTDSVNLSRCMAAEAEIIKSLRERILNLELLSIIKQGAQSTQAIPQQTCRVIR